MAVVTLFMSDKDPQKRTFSSKAEADALDRKLELAENLQAFLERQLPGLDENLSERIGLLLAEHKDAVAAACRGKSEDLLAIEAPVAEDKVRVLTPR